MKALSKPIPSSPGRTEKFPPPLMRFLRNNVSSKSSRKRSRSSPMFIRKKNTSVIETTQEPTSPKVTCIGQVRVRRSSSKSKNSSNSKTNLGKQTPFFWVRKALFSHHFFPRFHKLKPPRPFFRKWGLFFCFGYCKKVDSRDDSSRVESIPRELNHVIENSDDYITSTIVEAQESKEGSCTSTPPKNALLLARCRSAPYRSSSLASRFWGSPLEGVEDNQEKSEVHEQICIDEAAESRLSKHIEETESSVNEEGKSIEDFRGVGYGGAAAFHPLLLTRCKSEPARIGERLYVDATFWKHTRFDVSEPSSLHNCD